MLNLGMEGSRCIVHSPSMFPVVSNEVGNVCFSAIISPTPAVVRWSACGLVKGLLNGPGKGKLAADGPEKGLS